jgi:phosphoglycolate phosphatase-like HAD superfamily hydrolase
MARLVLFDLDGTLLQPRDPLHSRAFNEVLASFCAFEGSIDWSGTSGMVDRSILAVLFQRAGMDPGATRRALTKACRQMNASYIRGPIEPEDRTLPGARGVVERLNALGIPMGLLTGNVTEVAWGRVGQAGLRDYFVAGAFGDEAMRRSTLVRRAIRRCQAALACEFAPSEILVVGDTPRDIQAAHLAGVRCVAVATGGFSEDELQRERPHAVIPDLTDTEAVCQLLVSA